MSTIARLALAALALGSCSTPAPEPEPAPALEPESDLDAIARVQTFRALRAAGDYDAARLLMSGDPRRWWGERGGEGSPWTIGTRGRWADWDDHMQSTSQVLEWTTSDHSATLLAAELNDYYRLLERGPQQVSYTYFLDDEGLLSGYLIASPGPRDPGRTDDYLAWAAANEPEELAYLRPGGEIDPTGDRAQRTRAQLNRWRATEGLLPILPPPSP
jgi:hypothetical protein